MLHFFLLPTNSALYGFTTFCLPVHQLIDIWVVSHFWLVWVILLWKVMYTSAYGFMFSFLLGRYIGVPLPCDMVTLMFSILQNCHTGFQRGCIILHSHQQYTRVLHSPHSYQHLSLFLIIVTLMMWSGILSWFWFTFPYWLMMLSIFSCAYWAFIYLWKNTRLCKYIVHFFLFFVFLTIYILLKYSWVAVFQVQTKVI